ncbi:MAG: phosphotransferase [Acidimicrobiales bacterium]|nr:phosphotransferase [Acidimicrobiales bacterium]
MAATIPTGLDDITPDWLSAALRSSGVLGDDSTIATVESKVLGTGEGFAGDLARLTVTYASGSGPNTMVAKVPTSIDDNRNGSEMLGVYEREIGMYREYLPNLDLPLPQLYYADVDPNPNWDKQIDGVKKAERLPVWLLRFLSWLLRRFVKAESRSSVLILEDLAPAEIGDQVTGTSLERIGAVLDVSARLHASTWGDAAPQPKGWMQSGGIAPKLSQATFLGVRRAFLKGAGRNVSDHTRQLLGRLQKDGIKRGRRMHESLPQCLIHGDLRLDNIFFQDDEVRALIDWQLSRRGPAAIDVAYFIAGSVEPDVSETEVEGLLRRYHDALVANGVADYPFDRFMADYDDGLLATLGGVTLVEQLDMGDDRGLKLVDAMVSRLDARLARVPA